MDLHYPLDKFLGKPPSEGNLAVSIASVNDVDVEFYEPRGADCQTPHRRDEIYIIARGNGSFAMGADAQIRFSPGDMLFVPALAAHRFINFSSDFATWVFFFGSEREP